MRREIEKQRDSIAQADVNTITESMHNINKNTIAQSSLYLAPN